VSGRLDTSGVTEVLVLDFVSRFSMLEKIRVFSVECVSLRAESGCATGPFGFGLFPLLLKRDRMVRRTPFILGVER
jgi:hypothetical protein